MCDRDPAECVGFERRQCIDNYCRRTHRVATCEHDGCPWESTATTETAQLDAYHEHHEHHHQEG